MKSERWRQVDKVLQSALERSAAERIAFVDQACGSDHSLKQEVMTLLSAYDDSGSFIEQPAIEPAAEDQTQSLESGKVLGEYEVMRRLGTGGMGEVYLARHRAHDRVVALKILPDHFVDDPQRLTRFKQEARAVLALNHPNVVTAYDIGEADGIHFIATEFVDGETLRAMLERGRLPIGQATELGLQITGALVYAHEQGVVHRDIKPENVMLRPDGYVKVLDFGIAKLVERKSTKAQPAIAGEEATRIKASTSPGMVIGTANYMSPEQARGLPVDERTDLWSVGVLLYEMITGRPPFSGETTTDTILSVIEKEPTTLATLAPEAPEALEWIVMKALAKDKEERYQTARELLTDLKRLKRRFDSNPDSFSSARALTADRDAHLSTQTAAAQTAPDGAAATISSSEFIAAKLSGHRRGIVTGLVLGVIVLAGAGLGLYKFLKQRQASSPIAPLQSMKFTKLSATGGTNMNAISPDGKLIARVVVEAGKASLRLRQVAASAIEREILPPTEIFFSGLTFAPESSSIYYLAGPTSSPKNYLYRVPVIGGDPQKVIDDVDSAVTFSPDGKHLAFRRHSPKAGDDSLLIADVDGSNEQTIIREPVSLKHFQNPAWSPDNNHIAFVNTDKNEQGTINHTLQVIDLSNHKTSRVSEVNWRYLAALAWLPDGQGLIVVGRHTQNTEPASQLWHVTYPNGELSQITNDPIGYNSLSLTSDSRTVLAVQTAYYSSLWVVPSEDANRARQVTGSSTQINEFAWTPDRRFVYVSRASGNLDLWIMNADGSGNRQLTSNPGSDVIPAVSPDGRYIIFETQREGSFRLYRMNVDGSGAKELVRNIDGSGSSQISLDSQWVYYSSIDRNSGKDTLRKIPIDGGESVKVHEDTRKNWLSPDGQRFVGFARSYDVDTPFTMVIFPVAGGEPTQTIKPPSDIGEIGWSPDGRAIDFIAARNGVTNIWRLPLDGGPQKQITTWTTDSPLYWFEWSRDGKYLGVVRDNTVTDLVLIQNFR